MAEKDMKTEGANRMVEVIVLVIMLLFIWMVVSRIQQLLAYYTGDTFQMLWRAVVDYFLTYLWPIIMTLAVALGILSVFGIRHNRRKLSVIKKAEEEIYGKSVAVSTEAEPELKNVKWERVQQLINSTNESDWRQAIIEADIMLDELLTSMRYHGDSIGDKLQAVEPSDFLTLDSAWAAHKVRNRIAHDGATFQLNDRQARETISQFEVVFKEFKVI
jgi:hypothetical protein